MREEGRKERMECYRDQRSRGNSWDQSLHPGMGTWQWSVPGHKDRLAHSMQSWPFHWKETQHGHFRHGFYAPKWAQRFACRRRQWMKNWGVNFMHAPPIFQPGQDGIKGVLIRNCHIWENVWVKTGQNIFNSCFKTEARRKTYITWDEAWLIKAKMKCLLY